MLDKFRKAKEEEIRALLQLEEAGRLPAPLSQFQGHPRPSFFDALSRPGCAVIAEYKRASPSRGEINMHASPKEIAALYAQNGAAAMSVLTEEVYFKGSLDFLTKAACSGLPLLRKDFLFDPVQIRATMATPASAVLLIVRMYKDAAELAEMHRTADECGLDSVVEIFNQYDLERARQAGARIIQVNSRDLDTLRTDTDNALQLAPQKRDGEVWISASGIHCPADVQTMAAAGYDAVLVGTAIMAADDPAAFLGRLVRAGQGDSSCDCS
ncbi:MAG: indole-3-glycerol phosphate synthase TrpC [Desulfovibrio sp.]|uniref:indole-3-glycerol phosphate synthase TrpC n=1 Tax=Desulfovibrio sp. 7SRBS1 TaxID=3378064 RepID=UPI003B3D59C4